MYRDWYGHRGHMICRYGGIRKPGRFSVIRVAFALGRVLLRYQLYLLDHRVTRFRCLPGYSFGAANETYVTCVLHGGRRTKACTGVQVFRQTEQIHWGLQGGMRRISTTFWHNYFQFDVKSLDFDRFCSLALFWSFWHPIDAIHCNLIGFVVLRCFECFAT